MARAENRTLSIVARLKDLVTNPSKAMRRELKAFATSSISAFKGIAGQVFGLRGAIAGLVTGYLSLRGLQTLRTFGEQADQLKKLADSLGDTVANVSELEAAFRFAGASQESFASATRQLVAVSRQAIDGNRGVLETFQQLGITVQDLSTLGPSQLFERIAQGLDRFSTSQEKALVLVRLFPEKFGALLPLLGQGLDTFQKTIRDAREAGATVTENQAKAAIALNDSLTKVNLSIEGVGRALIEAFGPKVTVVLEELARSITRNRDQIVELAQAIGTGISTAVGIAIDAIIGLIRTIENIPGVDLIEGDKLRKEIEEIDLQLRLIEGRRSGQKLGFSFPLPSNQVFNVSDAEANARVDALLPREQELRDRLRSLQVTLEGGLAGALQRTRETLSEQLNTAAAKVLAPDDTAKALGLPTSTDIRSYADSAASVFQDAAGRVPLAALGSERADKAGNQQRLAALQQIAGAASQLRPLSDVLREIESIKAADTILALTEAERNGVISAEELARATGLVNAQLERQKDLVSGDFFAGFSAGAEEALASWSDFAAAGRDAAASLIDGGLNGISEAFGSIIDGTKSASEAFGDMARSILSEIARLIPRLLIIRALSSIFGPTPALADGGVLPGGVTDTIPVQQFARGGIATSPTMALFGEGRNAEAFVPLPDNRSIPVTLNGGGGGGTVNVHITAMDSKDVRRVLGEHQRELRQLWEHTARHRTGARQVIQRAAR